MTKSYQCYDHEWTRAYWCNDGMVLIIQFDVDPDTYVRSAWWDMPPFSGTCRLRPSELRQIAEWPDGHDAVIFEVDEVRAGLFPQRSRVRATLQDGNVLIEDGWYDGDLWYMVHGDVTLPKDVFGPMLAACCAERDRYEHECGIAPLVGINVRDEEHWVQP